MRKKRLNLNLNSKLQYKARFSVDRFYNVTVSLCPSILSSETDECGKHLTRYCAPNMYWNKYMPNTQFITSYICNFPNTQNFIWRKETMTLSRWLVKKYVNHVIRVKMI